MRLEPLEERRLLTLVPVGPEVRVNENTDYSQLLAEVSVADPFSDAGMERRNQSVATDHDGDYVVVWTSYVDQDGNAQDGDGAGVFLRMFDRNGVALTGDVQVNTFVEGDQRNASVAMDADGDFVVIWQSEFQDAYDGSAGIYAQRFDALGQKVGAEFQVHSTTVNDQVNPTVAMNAEGTFVAAWETRAQDGSFFNDVRGQLFNARGERISNEFRVNDNNVSSRGLEANPTAAIAQSGHFVVVWEGNSTESFLINKDILAKVYSPDALALGNEFTVNVSGAAFPTPLGIDDPPHERIGAFDSDQRNAAIAMDFDGNFIVVWESFQDNELSDVDGPESFGIYWRRFALTPEAENGATPASPDDNQANIVFTNSSTPFSFSHDVHPSVAMDADGDFVISFEGSGAYGFSSTNPDFRGIWMLRYHAGANFPVVGTTEGFRELPGSLTFFPQAVNTFIPGIQRHSSIAMTPKGDVVVVWDGEGTSDDQGIWARRYRETTDTHGPAVTGVLANGEPVRNGDQLIDADITQLAVIFDQQPSIAGGANGIHSVLNPNNWSLLRDGVDILGGIRDITLSLDPTLNKWVAVLTVDGDGPLGPPGGPPTPLTDGSYALVAHNTIRDVAGNPLGSRGSVTLSADATVNGFDFFRTFSVAVPIAQESQVNTSTTQNQSTFRETGDAVASDGEGNYVVVWSGFGNLPGQSDVQGIFMQRYDRNGNPLGDEVRVNTIVSGTQSHASVAMDADGDFVVSWSSYGHDATSGWDVFARRFNANGAARDAVEFRVNSETESIQRYSSVAMSVAGDFVVTWQSYQQDGSGYGVYAQRYAASGERLGGINEIQTLRFEGSPSSGTFRLRLGTAATAPTTALITYSAADRDDVTAQKIEDALLALGIKVEVTANSTTEFRVEYLEKDGSIDQPQLSAVNVSLSGGVSPQLLISTTMPGITGEFRVNDTILQNQRFPDVAMDADGDFVITWTANGQDGDAPFETNIYARRYDKDGEELSDEFLVNDDDVITITNPAGDLTLDYGRSSQQFSRVAMDHNGDFVIVWTSYNTDGVGNGYGAGVGGKNGIFGRRFNALGEDVTVAHPITEDPVRVFQVNTFADDDQQYANISMGSSGDFVIVWESFQDDSQPADGIPDSLGIYTQRYVRNSQLGSPLFGPAGEDGGEFRVNVNQNGTQRHPSVASDFQNNFVVVWTSVGQDGSGDGIFSRRFAQRVDFTAPIVTDVQVDGEQVREGVILENSDVTEIVVSFSEEVNNEGGDTGFNSVTNPANWALFLNDSLLSDVIQEILYQFNPATQKWEATLILDSDQSEPGNQPLSEGSYRLVVSDRIFDLEGNPLDGNLDGLPGGEYELTFTILPAQTQSEFAVNTTAGGAQRTFGQTPQAVAVDDDGDYVIVWSSYGQNGLAANRANIFMQRYNRDGVPLGGETRVFGTSTHQVFGGVAADADGDFVVTWSEYGRDGDGATQSNVYARRFRSDGAPLGSPNLVNEQTAGSQKWSSVAVDVDGDFVITWSSQGQDGSGYGVYGQRYDAAGAKQGSEFLVNTTTVGDQRFSQVAMDHQGNFVVTWTNELSATQTDIAARLFAADATPLSGEILVNTFVPGQQSHSAIAMDLAGNFVIAWQSLLQDGSGWGIYAQQFDAAGTAVNPEFQVSASALGDQAFPSIAMTHTGAFVVTWSGSGTELEHDDTQGVFARRFEADGTPRTPPLGIDGVSEFRVNTTVAGGQQFASIGIDGEGDFVVAWSGVGVGETGASAPGTFGRLFNEPGDVAGPIVSDVLFGGVQVQDNDTLTASVTEMTVIFSERMSQVDGTIGVSSVINPNNWRLVRNGQEIFGGVSAIDFALNPASNKWEAKLTLDGNGVGGGAQPLPDGTYQLIARDFMTDVSGNFLNGDYDTLPGGDWSVTFVVGTPVDAGDEFRVNTTTTDTQRTSDITRQSVAVDDDGDFVVVWAGGTNDASRGFDIFAQQFNADGSAKGSEFLVNTTTARDQEHPAVAIDADGDFVITWTSYGQDGDETSEANVYMRLFSAAGAALTPELTVSTTTTGTQKWSSVARDADGDIAVTWTGLGQDGDTAGEGNVYVRRFTAEGVPRGDEVRVNNLTTSYESNQTVFIPEEGTVTSTIEIEDVYTILGLDVTVDISHPFVGDLVLFLVGPDGQRIRLVGNVGGSGNNFTGTTFDDQAAAPISAGVPPFSGRFRPEEPLSTLVGTNVIGTWTLEVTDDQDLDDVSDFGVINGWSINVSHNALQEQVTEPLNGGGNQQRSRVSMNADGDFVVTWEDNGRDGSGQGVFAQLFDADGSRASANLLVNSTTLGNQSDPAVAMDRRNGDFVVSWSAQGQDGSGYGVYAQRYNESGVPLGGEFLVNSSTDGNQRYSSVASDAAGDFVIAWSGNGTVASHVDANGVFAQRFSASGARQGGEFRVNTSVGGAQQFASIGSAGDGDFVIVWSGNGSQAGQADGQGVFGQRFAEEADSAGPIVADVLHQGDRVTPGASLVGPLQQLVVTFGENMSSIGGVAGLNSILNPANWSLTRGGSGGVGGVSNITFGFNSTTNKYQAILTLDSNTGTSQPDPFGAGDYVLTVSRDVRDLAGNALDGAFAGTSGVGGNDFSLNFNIADLGGEGGGGPGGQPVDAGEEIPVNTTTLGDQNNSQVAVDADGNFVVVWVGDRTFSTETGSEVFQQVFFQRFNAAGVADGDESVVFGSFAAFPIALAPSVAMDDDGDFVITWTGAGADDEDVGIFAQRYNRFGVPVGRTFLVNTFTENLQLGSGVAMDANGNFVVTWTSYGQDGDRDGVYAQRFSAGGTRLGSEFRVNATSAGRQDSPSVAMDDDGNFVVAWNSFGQDGSSWGVYARRFNASGVAQGGEFQVNTFTTNAQRYPKVAMDADGDFVVAWQSQNQDGSGYGVYARRFTKTGASAGGEFRVNQTTTNWQQDPSVSMDGAGNFTVAWTTFGQDESANGIYARSFRADGSDVVLPNTSTPVGEFLVNSETLGDQTQPSIAVDPNGHFVVSWTGTDDTFTGTSPGVFAQRFRVGPGSVATAIGGPATISTVGLFSPVTSTFFLRDSNSAGPANNMFNFGPANSGWIPLTGDWNGDGTETVGFFDPSSSTFFLNNTNAGGVADLMYNFGPANSGWTPVVGDWDGNGTDTVGFYTGQVFFLKNSHGGGMADVSFGFGAANAGWTPIIGDWNGDGTDTVGFYNGQTFFLRNSHQPGMADEMFDFGPAGAGWKALAGDWDGNGTDTVGLHSGSTFFLRNGHAAGPADAMFSYGPTGSGWTPLAGSWIGFGGSALMAASLPVAPSAASSLGSDELSAAVGQSIEAWRETGVDERLLSVLDTVDVRIADLPGAHLGLAISSVVYIDSDAAGWGWHTDRDSASPADRMDLATVVAHELGHVLGLDDLDLSEGAHNLMAETLAPGVRKEPSTADLDEMFARDLWEEDDLLVWES